MTLPLNLRGDAAWYVFMCRDDATAAQRKAQAAKSVKELGEMKQRLANLEVLYCVALACACYRACSPIVASRQQLLELPHASFSIGRRTLRGRRS